MVWNCILRSQCHKSISHYSLAFKVYGRPILEYCSPIWFSFRSLRPIEHVLRHFTRLVAYIKIFGSAAIPVYEDRFRIFDLESMEWRLVLADLCFGFKIVHGLCDIRFVDFFEFVPNVNFTRGHRLKLRRKFTERTSLLWPFNFWVVPLWNSLPSEVVESPTIKEFKKRLRKLQFNYRAAHCWVFWGITAVEVRLCGIMMVVLIRQKLRVSFVDRSAWKWSFCQPDPPTWLNCVTCANMFYSCLLLISRLVCFHSIISYFISIFSFSFISLFIFFVLFSFTTSLVCVPCWRLSLFCVFGVSALIFAHCCFLWFYRNDDK